MLRLNRRTVILAKNLLPGIRFVAKDAQRLYANGALLGDYTLARACREDSCPRISFV